jgi:DNA-binding beta-propeller fold protein YncE
MGWCGPGRVGGLVSASLLGLGGAVVAVPGVAANSVSATMSDEVAALAAGHATVVRVDAESGEILAVLPTGPDPLLLCVAARRVWTMNFGDGTLTRVDPATDAATTLDVGEAVAIACDGDDVWVARNGNELARLNGATGDEETVLRLGDEPLYALRHAGFVAIAGGSLWLTIPARDARFSEALWRIDPHSGSVLATIAIGSEPLVPFADGGYLWVVTTDDQALTRIDIDTNDAVAVDVDRYPWTLVAGDGSMWIGHHIVPKVVRFDPHTLVVFAEVPLEADPRGLAFGGGRLWVTTESALVTVDPATDAVERTIEFGPFPRDTGLTGVAYLDGAVWVSVE